MATLTSTGAVNLTSATNWSPAQVPAPGDDLIIGAHTLTLNADMALGSVTFNNAASRLSIVGTPRVVEAVNGWTINAVTTELVTTELSSQIVTIRGRWNLNGNPGTFHIFRSVSNGSVLTVATITEDPSSLLISNEQSGGNFRLQIVSILSLNSRLNTVGLMKSPKGNGIPVNPDNLFGEWHHNSIGVNEFLDLGMRNTKGKVTFIGDATYQQPLFGNPLWSFTSDNINQQTFIGNHRLVNYTAGNAVIFGVSCAASGSVNLIGSASTTKNGTVANISSGTFCWVNQSAHIPANEFCLITAIGGAVDLSDLQLTVAGNFALISSTQLSFQVSGAAVYVSAGGGAAAINNPLASQIVFSPSPAPILPNIETVTDGIEYGYAAAPLIGTALTLDPAVLSAAVVAAIESTAPSGPYRLTISALDDGDLVPGVGLSIVGVSGTQRTTDTAGPVAIDLAAGEYLVRVSVPFGYDPVADVPVTLPGPDDDLDLEIALDRLAVTPPSSGNLCRVSLRVADESDVPWVAVPVLASITSGPAVVGTLHANRGEPTTTDNNGLVDLDLLRLQTYALTATRPDGVEITITRTIPDLANADLSMLLPA